MYNYQPVVHQTYPSIIGLEYENASNTSLTIFAGAATAPQELLSSTDLILSNDTTLDCTTVGLNGLDAGVLAVSSSYSVFLIGDPTGFKPVGVIASLTKYPLDLPQYPQGYGISRRIAYFVTDGSGYIANFLQGGSQFVKRIQLDVATNAVSGGTSATFVPIIFNPLVPKVPYLSVLLSTQNSGNYTTALRPTGNTISTTSNAPYRLAGTTAVPLVEFVSGIDVNGNCSIDYAVNGGNTIIQVCGWVDYLY